MTAHPLNDLLKKGVLETFQLHDDQFAAFKKFIAVLCSPAVLGLTKTDLPYSVETEDSE